MDPTLKASIDSAANILTNTLHRDRSGPNSIVAAANAVDGIRKAVTDAQTYAASITFSPTVVDMNITTLLSTPKVQNNSSSLSTSSTTSSTASSSAVPIDTAASIVASKIIHDIGIQYDRQASRLLEKFNNNNNN